MTDNDHEAVMDGLYAKYGMEILRLADVASVQILCNGWHDEEIPCDLMAKALEGGSEALRALVLRNLNRIRRQAVSEHLQDLLAHPNPWRKPDGPVARILEMARKLEMNGEMVFSLDIRRRLTTTGGTDSTFRANEEASRPAYPWIDPLGAFILQQVDPEALVEYWVTVAYQVRKDGPLALDAMLDKELDGFTRMVLTWTLSDLDDGTIRDRATLAGLDARETLERRCEIIRVWTASVTRNEPLPLLARRLNALFADDPLDPDVVYPIPEHRQAPPVNKDVSPQALVATLSVLAASVAAHGILSLESVATDDPCFSLAATMLVDGAEAALMDTTLERKKRALLWDLETRQGMLLDALLGIRHRVNPRMLQDALFAHIPDWGRKPEPKP